MSYHHNGGDVTYSGDVTGNGNHVEIYQQISDDVTYSGDVTGNGNHVESYQQITDDVTHGSFRRVTGPAPVFSTAAVVQAKLCM